MMRNILLTFRPFHKTVLILALSRWGGPVLAQVGEGYDLTWNTIESGDAASTGDGYEIVGSFGQVGEEITGGEYALQSGFWVDTTFGGGFDPPLPGADDVCVGGANAGSSCSQASDCPGGACRLKNRFATITIPVTATTHGIKVKLADLDANSVATPGSYEGTDRWAGVPLLGINDGISPSFNASRLQCAFHSQDWSAVGPVHLYGDVIVPLSSYDASICSTASGPCSTDLRITTAKFGDVVTPVNTVNFQDVNSIVAKFQGTPAGPSKTRTKLNGSIVNPSNPINFQEVSACVSAFQSKAFKAVVATPPATCP